ncbi:MAG: 4Fe-4S binding protein [Chloroflexi bacterium]|nr:4Fe-4S binding protein [Chloroflexota bacterium]
MTEMEQKIRAEAARLLSEGLVDVVVAFRKEEAPLRPQPAFFTREDDLEDLVYNGLCANNLANYLTRFPQETRIGMLVRGCENRSVNALVVEKQHSRQNLYLIGIPCTGIIDWRKVVALTGEDILAYEDSAHTLTVRARHQTFALARQELLHSSCLRCVHPNPLSADILLGEMLPEGDPALIRERVESFEALTRAERTAYFKQEAERCIRCYACREACPMCYCEECFVDHNTPRWTESSTTPAGTHAWHIIRAFHQTGRCTSCGACERACPMDIQMTYLTDKLGKDMWDSYQFAAGMDDQTQPPFASFTLDDKKHFQVGGKQS